jgi:hypothetical protein
MQVIYASDNIARAQAERSLVHPRTANTAHHAAAQCLPTGRVRRSVLSAVYQSLVIAVVLTRLNKGSAAQSDLPNYLHRRLQSVLSAAVRALIGRWLMSLRSRHRHSPDFTNSKQLSEFSSSWRTSSTGHCTAQRSVEGRGGDLC